MSIKKIAIAGIAGGVVYFLLGWLVYGMLLKDYYATHTNTCMMRPETDMIWWAMIASCLLYGILFAYIFNRWANITTLSAGLMGGGIISLLVGLSMSLGFYAYTTMYGTMTTIAVDIAVGVVMGAIVGAVVGLVLGKIKD
jgi:hypothetical protein